MKLKSCFVKYFAFVFLTIVFSSVSAIKAQNNSTSVRGKVTDANGSGLADVTVTVKGSTSSTITDANGFYKINLPVGEKTPLRKKSLYSLTLATNLKLFLWKTGLLSIYLWVYHNKS